MGTLHYLNLSESLLREQKRNSKPQLAEEGIRGGINVFLCEPSDDFLLRSVIKLPQKTLCSHHGRPLRASKGRIMEASCLAGINPHHYQTKGDVGTWYYALTDLLGQCYSKGAFNTQVYLPFTALTVKEEEHILATSTFEDGIIHFEHFCYTLEQFLRSVSSLR
ncbi:hypothetical protein D6774_04725 [Candidatus Woesearchaeota archaeon]|nr:MAG: hypothetical protein D6774_04725 [Candidatus Woesearchaeota archaeon]